MKVLHCISTANIGGIERLVIELAIAQKMAGISVAIMLDQRKGQFLDEIVEFKIPIYESKVKSGFEFSFSKLQSIKHIFNEFDIIHLHNFSLLRSFAAMKSKSKVVYTIHGLSKGIRNENFFKYFFREIFKKHFLNRVDFIISNSLFTLQGAKEDYGLKPNSKVILNGTSLKESSFITSKKKQSDFVIGLVSRFTARKRIDRLIDSFDLFLKKGGSGKLILVGDGQTYNSIVNQVKTKGIEEYVLLIGYSNDVAKYYQQFDICVFPSEKEPFGLVAVEAYNFGLPVLVYEDSGGLKEIIKPIEPMNIVKTNIELANRLLYYQTNLNELSDESKIKRINYVKENFSIERMEREYFKQYKEILK